MHKEQVIREFLGVLQGNELGRELEIGQFVLFLEKDFSRITEGGFIDMGVVWEYCCDHTTWSSAQYREIFGAVSESLSSAMFWPDTLKDRAPNSPIPDSIRQRVIKMLLSCVNDSPAGKILDPEKLEEFLQDELDSMWEDEALNLDFLWEVLSEAPQVTEEMLLETFLLVEMRKEDLPLKIWVPAQVRQLSPEAKEALVPGSAQPPTRGSRSAASSPSKVSRAPAKSSQAKARTPAAKPKSARPKKGTIRRSHKGFDDSPSFSPLLLVGLVIAVVAAFAYFAFIREAPPGFDGTPLQASYYNQFFPLKEIRVQGKDALVIISPEYQNLTPVQQSHKIFDLLRKLRKKGVTRLLVFDEEKKLLTTAKQ